MIHPPPFSPTFLVPFLFLLTLIGGTTFFWTSQAQAIPAFSRKYQVTCTVCHTRVPRLNRTGERFLENGYQLPGTEDGGSTSKRKLGDVTLDEVTHYLGVRLRGTPLRTFHSDTHHAGNSKNQTEFTFPEIFSLFAAGTATNNVGFFVELESNMEESATAVERGFVTFNNLGKHDLAHLRVGRFDPSAFSSYATLRQHFEVIPEDTVDNGSFLPPTINRISLTPAAFSAKFSGLYDRRGNAILPTATSLFHAASEIGIDLHGRPFGNWFFYQVGVLNGANEPFGDSNKAKDWYVHTRIDLAQSNYFSANISGFGYFGRHNAKVQNMTDVNWNRYGLSANFRYHMIDLYGAFAIDRITNLPDALKASFDRTATGLTVEANVLATDRFLIGLRYDHLDAGGDRTLRTSHSLIALMAKFYWRSNIAFFLRDDVNLRDAQGGRSPERNFRNAFVIGADLAF